MRSEVAIVSFACIMMGLLLYGLLNLEPHKCTIVDAKFSEGEFVLTKVGHVTGMVINGFYHPHGDGTCENRYIVRLYRKQSVTNTHVLSSDDPIEASDFSEVNFAEYELEEIK